MGGGASKKSQPKGDESYSKKSKGAIVLLKNRKGSLGLFTQSEKEMMQVNKIVQDNSVKYVNEIIYYSMITKATKMQYPEGHLDEGEPYIWITIDHAKITKIEDGQAGGLHQSPIKNKSAGHSSLRNGIFVGYPIGVAVEENGDILITINSEGDEGRPLIRKIVGQALLDCKVPPPEPDPPVLIEATTSTLHIGWTVPFEELGLVSRMEVHYRAEGRDDNVLNPWKVLCQKNWLMADKMEYTMEGLYPFQGYHFKVRAKNSVGFGSFSEKTKVYRTQAAPPETPSPPIFAQVTHCMIVLLWRPPRENGAPILSYTLQCKEPGGVFKTLYSGKLTSFTYTGLKTDAAYVFQLRCSNAMGETDWSNTVSCKTQATKTNQVNFGDSEALRAGDFWMECWDAKDERIFYFHKITGERTLQIPEEFLKHKEENQIPDDPLTEFRKKRYNFLRNLRLAHKKHGGGSGEKMLNVEVRRDKVFEDSFRKYSSLGPADMHRRTKIVFTGEEGIDSGGLTKDWFLLLSRCFSSNALKLFKTLPTGELELNPSGVVSEVSLKRLAFCGKIIAKAIYDRQMVDLPLCTVLYKHLLGMEIHLEDLAELDPALYKSLTWMKKNDITNVMFETFSVLNEDTKEDIDLKENGKDTEVSEENKEEYIELMASWRAKFQVAEQLEVFLGGIFSLIPQESFQVFEIDEMELLINGKKEIDADEIRAYTIFQGGFDKDHAIVLWFFQAMRELENEDKAKILKFCTGTDRIPIDGFDPPFNLTEGVDMSDDSLPRTHTCFNQLVLPVYSSYEKLKEKLLYAAENSDGFQLS